MLEGSGDLVSRLIIEKKLEATTIIWGLGFRVRGLVKYLSNADNSGYCIGCRGYKPTY